MADRSVVYRLKADISDFRAQMAAAGKSVGDAANKMTAADKQGVKFRQGLDSLGGTAGKVGLAAAAGLGAAIAKAANFDQSMSNVRAATGETADNMDKLRQAALDAGAQTAFSATEAAEGIENLAKAGVSTQEIIGGGLAGALDLAAAGQMDVASAAEAAAGAMAQFKLEGEDVPHIADLLAAGAGKAQGDVSDMVMALKQAGTVSAQTGLTLEETTGTLAAMAEQSLLGSDAGTSFKTMLASLTPNSDKAAAAMEKYNIHAFDAQGNFVGMTELAGQLRDGLGGLTDEQRAMTLETIFGSDAVRAASIIYDNGAAGIEKWINNTNDAGYAAEQAAARLDNLKGDLEELGGALETALIGTGDGSQGMLRGLTQGLTDVINAYNDLPPAAQTATAGVMGGAAVIGGSIWMGSKLVQGIANTREALSNLGISGGKAATALGKVGRAVGIATTAFLAADIITDFAMKVDKAAPGTEAMTRALTGLGDAATSSGLSGDLASMGESIDRLIDPGKINAIDDVFSGITGGNRSLKEARIDIEALDDGLANMANTQGIEASEAAFQELAQAIGLTPAELDKLAMEHMPQYREAIAGIQNEATEAAGATGELEGATKGAGAAMERTAEQTEKQAAKLKEARKAAHATAGEFINLGDKLDNAKVSLGGWLRELEKQAEDLRNFRLNAEKAAENGLRRGLIAALHEAGPAGARRMRQLANASESEIGRANRAWERGRAEMKKYEDFRVSPKKVDVDISGATRSISALETRLRQIADEDVFVNVRHRRVGGNGGFGPQLATGGPVYGAGTGTSDSIPAWLSNGEHVWTAREVANAGGHEAVEAMRSQFRFAQGGAVRVSAQQRISFAPASVEIRDPWGGTQRVELIARAAARSEIAADRDFDRMMSRG